ncbi:MAG: 50S ribosomal protein L3 [Chlamydiae bacterium]|nr:50S ribosomal protein L3 [Chlamydiota bacterium]
MTQKLIGKKLGMTRIFDESGHAIVCTVIEVEPNVVVQIKTKEKDGYTSIQTGYEKIKTKDPRTVEKRVKKPILGHYKQAGLEPHRYLTESRIENTEAFSLGQEIGVGIFKDTPFVDATAKSIGKGYQGAMKLYHFAGQPASHGAKKNHRSLGSTGNRSTPGRNFPGGKRACHMGNKKVTVQNVKIVEIDEETNLILLKGAVPGPRNGVVTLQQAKKKTGASS